MLPCLYGAYVAYSGQAKIAFDHGFNDALFGRARNNPYDAGSVPKSVTAYNEGFDLGLISDTPPRGPRGTSMLTGTGVPSATLGSLADVYIDAANGSIYKKTGGATWTFQGPGAG